MKEKKCIVLLDMHALLHRSYHALPDFTSPSGEPTGALYGFFSLFLKMLSTFSPHTIIGCYDLPEPTLRHIAFKDYKAHRIKTEENLIFQIKKSKEMLTALSIPYYEKKGFEADDLLGTLAEEYKKDKNITIIIVSGDMDTLQLVEKKQVQVYTLKKGLHDTILYDERAVENRFHFSPLSLPDFKGLRGDPSDNIPGIKGIGEKTATLLIEKYGTLEKIYKEIKKENNEIEKMKGISPRILSLLKEGEDDAFFSKMLAKIERKVDLTLFPLEKEWKEKCSLQKAFLFLDDLGFKNSKKKLEESIEEKRENKKTKEEEKTKQIQEKKEKEQKKKEEKEESYFYKEDEEEICIAFWLLNSEKTHPLLSHILSSTEKKTKEDARLFLEKEIKEKNLSFVYEKIEKPLIPLLKKMRKRGILIDTSYLSSLSATLHKEIEKYTEDIYTHAGVSFNINSPKQLGEILFSVLEIGKGKKGKKTKGGKRSTNEDTLSLLKEEHPIIEILLKYREVQKILSTYIDAFPPLIDENSRLHPFFIQTGTTTGRLSSERPNMQNIPMKGEWGVTVRRAIISPKNFVLIGADYSQIELRIAGMIAQDQSLLEIFSKGGDVHSAVASALYNKKEDEIQKDERNTAKIINFGILYGMGARALSKNLMTDTKSAQKYLDAYAEKFQGIVKYKEKIKNDISTKGYTETLFGRRRYFSSLKNAPPFMRAQMERMAQNAPIQGTQADIIKYAMVRIEERIQKEKLEKKVFCISQIHDELLFEVEEGEKEKAKKLIKEEMENIPLPRVEKKVPLLVKVKEGYSWGEMEEK